MNVKFNIIAGESEARINNITFTKSSNQVEHSLGQMLVQEHLKIHNGWPIVSWLYQRYCNKVIAVLYPTSLVEKKAGKIGISRVSLGDVPKS